jgi:surfeit locus 1 family protein
VLKLQNFQGQPGVHLVVPLVLADGETAVLVDRGWVPDVLKDELSSLTEAGPVTVNGYVALPQTLSRAANIAPPETLEWFRLDIEQIQSQIPYQLLPIYIVEWTEDVGTNTADLPVPIEREIDLSEGSHLSYAIQWFIFSLILGIGYVIFVRRSLNV